MNRQVLILTDQSETVVPGFGFGDKVTIDGGDIVCTVVGISIYPHGCQFQVSWWNAGALNEPWIAEHRLKMIETAG